ncbi:hypothetical protein DPMN_000301 [Dreissena polymorpha]|uniref:Uncharacterized protein n=1 Tax=Dreissena polymorpha TaxID=45954 RepID=A0A9D4MH36_DREPO|nr:hypothetical protein DPMN_000301 [Dreissena polymorpha]
MNTNNPAAAVIARYPYVDNVISSFHSENAALSYSRYARDLMNEAGFNLPSWDTSYSSLSSYERSIVNCFHGYHSPIRND